MDIAAATPELWTALADAQARARCVKKAGENLHARYRYATAEDMIAEGRRARSGTGLSLLVCPRVEVVSDRLWVHLDWTLAHASGGVVTGTVNAPVQSSKRNGSDKQIAALSTYLHGFIERDLMGLDRSETPPEEDRDAQRDEPPPPVDHAAELRRIRAAVERMSRAGELDEGKLARAIRAASRHGADEATVRSWLPEPDPPGVFPDLHPALRALADPSDAETLEAMVWTFGAELRKLDKALVGRELLRHAERVNADVAVLERALAGER